MSAHLCLALAILALATTCICVLGEGTACAVDATNDVKLLNFALTVEQVEIDFHSRFLKQFSRTDFATAGFDASVFDRFTLILAHEAAHATALRAAISARGGVPVPSCAYTFPSVTDVMSYVVLTRVFESTGVSALVGGLNNLADTDLQQTAATIATVEARHAAYVNTLLGMSAFPNATDVPLTPPAVFMIVAPFIVSCPYAWNDTDALPVIRPNGGAFVSTQAPPPMSSASLPRGTYTQEQLTNDLLTLNYALSLENLEASFYSTVLSTFSPIDFSRAGFNQSVRDNFVLIGAHEAAHVSALRAVIQARNGVPVAACSYQFNLTSVTVAVATAALLENMGVTAYDGAANTISDTGVQESAATIATVEARHAAYLNQLSGQTPFNASQDTPVSPAMVLAAALAFIMPGSCTNGMPTLPSGAPQSSTPCPIAQTPLTARPSCALSSITLSNGIGLTPMFAAATTQYACAPSSSNTDQSVAAVTITSSVPAAQMSLNETTTGSSSLQQILTPGVQSSMFLLPQSGSASVTLNVGVPGLLLALGDSITFGETDLTYHVSAGDRGYVGMLADAIDARNGAAPRPIVQNLAIDGETASSFMTGVGRTPPVTSRTDVILAQQNAHYVSQPSVSQSVLLNISIANATSAGQLVHSITITLGFNELAALATDPMGIAKIPQTLADYRSNYRAVLRQVRAVAPQADLYMLAYYNPFPANPASPAAPIFNMGGGMLNAIVSELAVEFGGFLVDTFTPFVGREAQLTYLAAQPADSQVTSGPYMGTMSIGNVHPNDLGYAVIAQAVTARLAMNGTLAGDCSGTYVITCTGRGNSATASLSVQWAQIMVAAIVGMVIMW